MVYFLVRLPLSFCSEFMLFLPHAEIWLHFSFLGHVSAYFLLLGNVGFVRWGFALVT